MTEPSVAAVAEPENSFTALRNEPPTPETTSASEELTDSADRSRGSVPGDSAASRALPVVTNTDRLDLLSNVEMDVTAELGRTRMTVRDLLSLTPGIVVELDRMAGSPIDLFVNGTLIARGEVVVIDEEFGVRISEIVGPGAADNAR
jgi:flagellar motor switch protein FliN